MTHQETHTLVFGLLFLLMLFLSWFFFRLNDGQPFLNKLLAAGFLVMGAVSFFELARVVTG